MERSAQGHRGWVNYFAVAPRWRKRGFGRGLMQHVEHVLQLRGCPKINLQVRNSNAGAIAFYRRIGYDLDDSVSLGKRLISDRLRGA